MIKDYPPNANNSFKLTVATMSGASYIDCDVPPEHLCSTLRVVRIWFNERLFVIPLDNVAFIEYTFDK